MIIVGIGANLSHPDYGVPRRTCGAALETLARNGVTVSARSRWYESEPVVRDGATETTGQRWYVNGAVRIEAMADPADLLNILLRVEEIFGRIRSIPDAPRTLDLDILAFNQQVIDTGNLTVPHPRLYRRAFALLPIADLAPDWRHPQSGVPIADLIANLGDEQGIRVQPDAAGYMGTEWGDSDPSRAQETPIP